MPYSCWSVTGTCTATLYCICLLWMQGCAVPLFSNEAWLWILPKGAGDNGIFELKDTRPLYGGNSCSKLLASALNCCFTSQLGTWAVPNQAGFINGRSLLQNVVDVEGQAISNTYDCTSSAILLFDFAAAFPSVARFFIWIALKHIGIPTSVILAIKMLYNRNYQFIANQRGPRFAFCAYSGVRQGCPLSAIIFILVTNCFLIALQHSLPDDLVCGYADDLAIVTRELFRTLPVMIDLFRTYEHVSGLALNVGKCVIIPLWHYSRPNVTKLITEYGSAWKNIAIKDFVKYLGFIIGHKCDNNEWAAVEQHILDIGDFIYRLGLPRLDNFILFNMYCIAKVLFLAQLRKPSNMVHVNCSKIIRKLTGGPGNWISEGNTCQLQIGSCFLSAPRSRGAHAYL